MNGITINRRHTRMLLLDSDNLYPLLAITMVGLSLIDRRRTFPTITSSVRSGRLGIGHCQAAIGVFSCFNRTPGGRMTPPRAQHYFDHPDICPFCLWNQVESQASIHEKHNEVVHCNHCLKVWYVMVTLVDYIVASKLVMDTRTNRTGATMITQFQPITSTPQRVSYSGSHCAQSYGSFERQRMFRLNLNANRFDVLPTSSETIGSCLTMKQWKSSSSLHLTR